MQNQAKLSIIQQTSPDKIGRLSFTVCSYAPTGCHNCNWCCYCCPAHKRPKPKRSQTVHWQSNTLPSCLFPRPGTSTASGGALPASDCLFMGARRSMLVRVCSRSAPHVLHHTYSRAGDVLRLWGGGTPTQVQHVLNPNISTRTAQAACLNVTYR